MNVRRVGERAGGGWVWVDPIDASVTDALGALGEQLEAGVPLIRALEGAGPICRSGTAKALFAEAAMRVQSGADFSDVLDALRGAVSYPERAMLIAGWNGGRLEWAMRSVTERRRALHAARRRLRSGLIYPAFMLVAASGLVALVSLVQGSVSVGGAMMMAVTPPGIAVGLFLLVRTIQRKRARELDDLPADAEAPGPTLLDEPLTRLPLLATVERWRNLSEAAGLAANLLAAGVGMNEALRSTARSLPNGIYRRRLVAVADRVAEGAPLYEAIGAVGGIPPHWVNTLEVAYTAGSEPESLARLAEEAREKYLSTVKSAAAWVSYGVYAVVALYVIYQILAIFMGIMDSGYRYQPL